MLPVKNPAFDIVSGMCNINIMFGVKSYIYLIDSLTDANAPMMRTALETIPGVKKVLISPVKGLIEIQAKSDVIDSVKLACDVAGVKLRTQVK